MGLLIISRTLDVPFFYIFKLPQLLSDVGTALLLAKISKKIGSSNSELLIIAIFSISPVGILMTGYHGNTDSLCQFGIVGSVFSFGPVTSIFNKYQVNPCPNDPFFLFWNKDVVRADDFFIWSSGR
jgi:Gpi18-like mannosyltransferase